MPILVPGSLSAPLDTVRTVWYTVTSDKSHTLAHQVVGVLPMNAGTIVFCIALFAAMSALAADVMLTYAYSAPRREQVTRATMYAFWSVLGTCVAAILVVLLANGMLQALLTWADALLSLLATTFQVLAHLL